MAALTMCMFRLCVCESPYQKSCRLCRRIKGVQCSRLAIGVCTIPTQYPIVAASLRCGLLPEALQLARTYAAAQPDAAARHAALSRLVAGIASWALAAQQQESQASGHHHHNWARTTLLELCFSAEVRRHMFQWDPLAVRFALLSQ